MMHLGWMKSQRKNDEFLSVGLLLLCVVLLIIRLFSIYMDMGPRIKGYVDLRRDTLKNVDAYKRLSLGIPVFINSDDIYSLQALPYVGPKRAERILKWRNTHGKITNMEELCKILHIGINKIGSIKSYIYLK